MVDVTWRHGAAEVEQSRESESRSGKDGRRIIAQARLEESTVRPRT